MSPCEHRLWSHERRRLPLLGLPDSKFCDLDGERLSITAPARDGTYAVALCDHHLGVYLARGWKVAEPAVQAVAP